MRVCSCSRGAVAGLLFKAAFLSSCSEPSSDNPPIISRSDGVAGPACLSPVLNHSISAGGGGGGGRSLLAKACSHHTLLHTPSVSRWRWKLCVVEKNSVSVFLFSRETNFASVDTANELPVMLEWCLLVCACDIT